jgi:N-acetylglucosaminyl-diphospho-decaprenol L-rhamnosyltransferase
MLLSIIIVNYHQEKYLNDCISSINKYISCEHEIIVVNNSDDNINIQDIKLITSENKGYSFANNKGVDLAVGEYLLFLNPDTVITKDFYEMLISQIKDLKFGCVGLGLCNPDKSFQLSFGVDNTFLGEITNKKQELAVKNKSEEVIEKINTEYNALKVVDWVSGAAMLTRKEDFIRVGKFDERYFLYYEDADLCMRFKSDGYNNYYLPHTEIIHLKGENTQENFYSDTYYYAKESQLIYYKIHNGYLQYIILRFYLFSRFLLKYLFKPDKVIFRIIKLVVKGVKV